MSKVIGMFIFFLLISSCGNPETQFPDMKFVQIPAGSFNMGSRDFDSDELPVHAVNVDSFEIMATEVTQSMWQTVMGTTVYDMRDRSDPDWMMKGVGAEYPMYYVSWHDCHEFINALNHMDPTYTYRLPTEAEWEYACRAGTTTEYYWGNSDEDDTISRYCWYFPNSDFQTHPVGGKIPNEWLLYDMNGNVWEWCLDSFSDYRKAGSDGMAWLGENTDGRIERGGSWITNARCCRSSNRYRGDPSRARSNLGFRLVRTSNITGL